MKDWYHHRPWNLTHRIQLWESRHMTYHTTALLPNSCGPMADGLFRDPKGSVLSTFQILDPSIKDWYKYRPWNTTHNAQVRESRHMTYHKTALLPNSYGPLADRPFRHPKGRSYPHPKYWTHRWRIDINIDHWIPPIDPSLENQDTWQIIRRHYYQIAAAQWRMVHFETPRVGPILTHNIGPIDEGLISILAVESHP